MSKNCLPSACTFGYNIPTDGVIAQLVARLNGIQKVRGSNPLSSTRKGAAVAFAAAAPFCGLRVSFRTPRFACQSEDKGASPVLSACLVLGHLRLVNSLALAFESPRSATLLLTLGFLFNPTRSIQKSRRFSLTSLTETDICVNIKRRGFRRCDFSSCAAKGAALRHKTHSQSKPHDRKYTL